MSQRPLQLCFGGAFDPVHNGHLRILWEVSHALKPDVVRLLPSHIPPHKDLPEANPRQRLEMLHLALRDQTNWHLDQRELQRQTPSYTVETLRDLRRELGSDVALVWLLGMDSFASLDAWHRWDELTDHAHLVVVGRPGASLPQAGPVAEWAQNRRAGIKDLRSSPAGGVAYMNSTQQDIASSALRAGVRAGLTPRYLVPDSVCTYIVNHKLYR